MSKATIHSRIIIAGAGPAGIIAALMLGKNGIPCLLIDEGRFPRPKICGDGLSGRVISTLSKIDPAITTRLRASSFVTDSWAVRFISPSLKMVEISFKPESENIPPGYICTRSDFDHFLLEEALKYPSVEWMESTHIDQMERINGSWRIIADQNRKTMQADMLLIATGCNRSLINQICPGYPPMGEEGIGARAYFENVGGTDGKHAIEIHFLKELLPWYLWIFPYSDGSANVGLALPLALARGKEQSLRELLFTLIEKYPYLKNRFARARLAGKVEAHRLPFYNGRMKLGGEGYLLLGDAARLIDPFTGEGISHAMISGKIAAEVISGSMKNPAPGLDVAEKYESEIYKKLGRELELGLKLQQLATKPRLLNLVIGRAEKSEKVRQRLEEMLYSINSKGKLSKSWFYLKLMLGL